MGYLNFFSFAKGLQDGYNINNYPVLSSHDFEQAFSKALLKIQSSYDIEQDIKNQFMRGEIDQWEAVDALEEELGLSYDEACKKISSIGSSAKKRKKSKYNGALVNNTFDDASTGVSTVVPAVGIGSDVNVPLHPSTRFLVVNSMVSSQRRCLVRSSLSGSLDTFLMQNYLAGLGSSVTPPDIKDTGDNGRVVLRFDSNSGHSTEVDLGAKLDSGYVVESINDELGLFPEGIVDGDFLEVDIIQQILRSQGERDR